MSTSSAPINDTIIISVQDLASLDKRPSRVSAIPFEIRDGKPYFYLVFTSNGIFTSIGGGIDPADNNWLETLEREYDEEIGRQLPWDRDVLPQCKVAVRQGSWTIFIPVTPDDCYCQMNEMSRYPITGSSSNDPCNGKTFASNQEILRLHCFNLDQFFYMIDTSIQKSYRVRTPISKFISDLADQIQLEQLTKLNVRRRSEPLNLTDYPPERPIEDFEDFKEKLDQDPNYFHNRIIVTHDPDHGFYLGYHQNKICEMPYTRTVISQLKRKAKNNRNNTILYSVPLEKLPLFKLNSDYRDLADLVIDKSLAKRFYIDDYNDLIDGKVSGRDRCLYLMAVENQLYEHERGKKIVISADGPRDLINWVILESYQNKRLVESSQIDISNIHTLTGLTLNPGTVVATKKFLTAAKLIV